MSSASEPLKMETRNPSGAEHAGKIDDAKKSERRMMRDLMTEYRNRAQPRDIVTLCVLLDLYLSNITRTTV